jgi:hypothetical protein
VSVPSGVAGQGAAVVVEPGRAPAEGRLDVVAWLDFDAELFEIPFESLVCSHDRDVDLGISTKHFLSIRQ